MAMADVLARAELVFSSMSPFVNQMVIALVIILVGFIIGKIAESVLRNLFGRLQLDERFTRFFGAKRNYSRAIRRTIVRIIYLISVILSLEQLSLVGFALLAVEVVAVLIVLISFVLAGLDAVPQIAGWATLRNRGVSVGDEVVFSDQSGMLQGTISDMTLVDVRIKRRNGDVFFIPNASFLKNAITKKRKA